MIKALDFFCGGGGMTRGLLDAGIKVIAGLDVDPVCEATYLANNKPADFILEDIELLHPEQLETGYKTKRGKVIKIRRNDDNLLFVGCSPCQYWTKMTTQKRKAKWSRNLLDDFELFVDYFNPGYVVVENVPGIFHSADSPLIEFLSFLSDHGYKYLDKGIVKVWEHGVPQTRKRFLLIASRIKPVSLPSPNRSEINTVRNAIGDINTFPPIPAGHNDPTPFCHTTQDLKEINLERLRLTPKDGGTRAAWASTDYQLPVYARHEKDDDFGFQDVYGRMYWDRPAPTITTRFYSISNGRFVHPDQDRPISLREGATLQTFPPSYEFKADSIAKIGRLIGNAVPPELARRIGMAVLSRIRRQEAFSGK